MSKKIKKWYPAKGYIYVLVLALAIALLGAWKYNLDAFRPTKEFDPIRFWILSAINFVIFFIPGLLLTRFYYKLKEKNKNK